MNHMVVEQERRTGGYGADPLKNTGFERANDTVKEGAKSRGTAGAYAVDLSGSCGQETVCETQGKNLSELMQEAGHTDVAVQKDYLVVMSASMSTEDFARLQKEGTPPGSADLETVVTIVDEIKAALARSGQQITGYTDDLDAETLKQITGSEGLANEIVREFHEKDLPVTEENVKQVMEAFERAAALKPLDDPAKQYLLANHMEPTVANLYLAQHCAAVPQRRPEGQASSRNPLPEARTEAQTGRRGGGYYQDESGYYAKRAEGYDWEKLRPQMENVIKDAGLAVTEDTLFAARWLVERGMPLDGENLSSLCTLEGLAQGEITQTLVAAAAAAISDGKSAAQANPGNTASRVEKAAQYVEAFAALKEETVDAVSAAGAAGKEDGLTLRALSAAQAELAADATTEKSGQNPTGTYPVDEDGRRLLEQVRLKMSVEANLRLLRKGISIDTTGLSRLVEELDQAVRERKRLLFGGDESQESAAAGRVRGIDTAQGFGAAQRAACYEDTVRKAAQLPGMPAAVIGRFAPCGNGGTSVQEAAETVAFTLNGVYEEGKALAAAYTRAGESYEMLMTAPRADLGDSIKKAFHNVDELLQELSLPLTNANRRAVRILGYNRMDVTQDNIEAVKSTDLTVQRVMEKMTPSAVLGMIREGINPLSMNLEELEAYLDLQERSPERDYNCYAKYLYTLDKNGNVTPQERESYIGIYRLFRQLEKTDGAAIGALVAQGIEPTVSRLLSAVRSGKKQGMDYTVDDGFGGLDASGPDKSISGQIESAFQARNSSDYQRKLAADIFDRLDAKEETLALLTQRFQETVSPVEASMGQVLSAGENFFPDLTLEELSETLREADQDTEADREWTARQAQELRSTAGRTEEAVLKELLSFDQPVTLDHLAAGAALFKERGRLAGRMKELSMETGKEAALSESMEQLAESMGEETTAKEAYQGLVKTFTDILEEAVYGDTARAMDGRIDLKEIRSLYKQISLAADLAGEESYEVPVDIGGHITAIHLRILRGEQEGGRVSLSMETEALGRVEAQLHLAARTDGSYRLSGYFACDREETAERIRNGEGLRKALEASDIKIDSLPVILEEGHSFDRFRQPEAGAKKKAPKEAKGPDRVPTQKLYLTAKALIGYIRKGEGLQDENML